MITKPLNIYTHIKGRFSLPQFQMFGFVLMALGGYLIFKLNWLGLIPLAVGLPLMMVTVGIQIDLEKKLHREFIAFFSFKIGKWQPIPELEYITIYVERYAQRGSVVTIDSVNSFIKVKVSLIVSKTIRFDAGFFDSKKEAFAVGKLLAKRFDTRLLDFTEKEPKWVDLEG